LWTKEFRLISEANLWDEDYAMLQLIHKLNPAARYWLDGLREYYDGLTVEKILENMVKFYNKTSINGSYMDEVISLRQRATESVMEYHARFMKLVYKVNLQKDQRTYWFRRGLLPSLKSKISLATFNSDLYGMLLKAKELEQLNNERYSSNFKIKSKIKIKPEKKNRSYIICNYCHKPGHIESKCFAKLRNNPKANIDEKEVNKHLPEIKPKISYQSIESFPKSYQKQTPKSANAIRDPMHFTAIVNNTTVKVLLDTGSAHNSETLCLNSVQELLLLSYSNI